MTAPAERRYAKVLQLRRKKKLTFEEIGKLLGISRQRAWELYTRAAAREASAA